MREIKFRIFDKHKKHMHKLDSLFLDEKMFRVIDYKEEHDVFSYDTEYFSVPMQYTGLKDKKGVEIYEDDIVKTLQCVWDNDGKSAIMQVVFINGHQHNGFVGKIINNEKLGGVYIPPYSRIDSSYEVIGNIYENPELLKGAK